MTKRISSGFVFALWVFCAMPAQAGTLEQDEARIDALIRAERAEQQRSRMLASAEPVPVAATVVAPAVAAVPNEDWLAPPPLDDGGLRFDDLTRYVGGRVTIVTVGQRVHRGVIRSVDARQVILQVRRAGGNATYALHRDQVARIDPH